MLAGRLAIVRRATLLDSCSGRHLAGIGSALRELGSVKPPSATDQSSGVAFAIPWDRARTERFAVARPERLMPRPLCRRPTRALG